MENEVNSNNEVLQEGEDFAAMLEKSFKDGDKSSFIEGVIVDASGDEFILVDVNKKQEGHLKRFEITDENGDLKYKNGDKIEVVITGMRGETPVVSHLKAARKKKVREFMNQNEEEVLNSVMEAKIVNSNKGGFILIDENEVEYFLPKSQVGFFKNQRNLVGTVIKAKIIKLDKDSESIIISRKRFIDDKRKEKRELIAKIMEQEEAILGVIKQITTFGMFVDVGGVDGLVHYSEISYKGPVNPKSMFEEGEEVYVKAIKYDAKKRHLSLSIKAANPDPWEEIKEQLEVGDAIMVTVNNIEPYGVFVDLGNDVEGFLHISEISRDKHIKHPKDYLELGQEIDVEVIEINMDTRRLRVSLKNLLPDPFVEFLKNYKEGDIVKGEITTLTTFGAFVKIDNVEGLLHNEDISWKKGDKCRDLLKTGEEIEVKIISIDKERQKLSLSKKVLVDSPIAKFMKEHRNGDIVNGTIRDIKEFGVFVEIEEGVDALIRLEDLEPLVAEELNKKDSIEAAIAFMDNRRDRIRLSVKRVERIREQQVLKNINDEDDGATSLGEIIRDQLR